MNVRLNPYTPPDGKIEEGQREQSMVPRRISKVIGALVAIAGMGLSSAIILPSPPSLRVDAEILAYMLGLNVIGGFVGALRYQKLNYRVIWIFALITLVNCGILIFDLLLDHTPSAAWSLHMAHSASAPLSVSSSFNW